MCAVYMYVCMYLCATGIYDTCISNTNWLVQPVVVVVVVVVAVFNIPDRIGATPVARQIPSKLFSNTSLFSISPPPLLVTSMPAALLPNIRLFLKSGWLFELIKTPAAKKKTIQCHQIYMYNHCSTTIHVFNTPEEPTSASTV